uniref:Uncharacterized protein n=1 Tax=Globisporangium ultimum (strain ATCC 200006 / CBS 805.95 / DAOM BR144) TaxID=431595 RepID=K3X3J1_GLOUD
MDQSASRELRSTIVRVMEQFKPPKNTVPS